MSNLEFTAESYPKIAFWTGFLFCNGALFISNNKRIMKNHINNKLSNSLGIGAFILMTGAALLLIYYDLGLN